MIIRGGNIFTESGTFQIGTIHIKNNIVHKLDFPETVCEEKEDEIIIDATNLYVLPGLVDIHTHGAFGADFCDGKKESLETIENYFLKNGITSVFPATMTLDEENLEDIFSNASEYVSKFGKGIITGITMEGPFISCEKKGAQNERYIKIPDIELFRKMQKKSGNLIKQVAVAPEKDEDYKFVSEVSKETIVSLAHSGSDYEKSRKAFENGAKHVTHLFNGMNPFLHREPGIVGAAFDCPEVSVEMICDGVHLHPAVVRAVFQMFGAERVCMISDSMGATGMSDGEYSLGGQKVIKKGNVATLEDGTIAGSVCNLYECFKIATKEMNIPLEKAVLACTKTPAKSLGMDNKMGIIKEDRRADLLLLDQDLNIKYVLKDGIIAVENS